MEYLIVFVRENKIDNWNFLTSFHLFCEFIEHFLLRAFVATFLLINYFITDSLLINYLFLAEQLKCNQYWKTAKWCVKKRSNRHQKCSSMIKSLFFFHLLCSTTKEKTRISINHYEAAFFSVREYFFCWNRWFDPEKKNWRKTLKVLTLIIIHIFFAQQMLVC